MRGFFKPWRRKIGVAALVTACVVVGMWIRSFSSWDHVYFSIGRRTHEITSVDGGIAWLSWDHAAPEWGFRSDIQPADKAFAHTFVGLIAGLTNPYYASWNMRWWSAFYWQLAIPLSLLSAWLLLSKPRTMSAPTPKAAAETSPEMRV